MKVAVHGMLGGAGDWRGLLPAEDDWRCPELWRWWRERGDLSPAGEGGEGVGAEVGGEAPGSAFEQWAEWLDGQAGQGDVLVGYSLGGRLALHAWLRNPGRWRQVWIVSAHPGLEDEAERWRRREADAGWAARLETEAPEGWLASWDAQGVLAGGLAPEVGQARMERLIAWRVEMARAMRGWSLGRQRPLWDDIVECAGADAGVLHWVTGERDAKFCGLARQLQRRLPGLQWHLVEGAGHRVPWEQPRRWLALLERYL